ncbi:unnamed protein product [Trichobilharzia regenti]|nr:unnamed protein product [Trichobilharzia regenti]
MKFALLYLFFPYVYRKVTDEICCCPKPLTKQPVCNHQKNIIVQKQTHFTLITPTNNTQSFKSYCQPKSSQISIQVKCGQKFQRIRVKPCDGEFHHITVLKPIVENCACKQKILQNLKIRCGCPTAVRHIPGACINQWALHKWVGLKSVATGGENPYQVTEKSCKPEILEQRRIRCACPPVQVFKKCFKHNLLSIQRVYYKLNQRLNNCEMYKTKEFKRLNCPKPTVQNYPCDNDPKSPNRGYKVSKIQHFVGQNCSCIPKVKVERKICNCKPLKRMSVGKCEIGPDSVWTQKIDELILTAVNCQCVWRVKHSEKKICKCPNPVKKQRCINNGQQLMHIITKFNLEGDKCKASQQEIEVDPCAHIKKDFSKRPLFHIGKCDPTTCKAKRSDFRFSVKNCQCQILQ